MRETKTFLLSVLLATVAHTLGGCASKPLMPYTTDTTPMVMVPAIQTAEQDQRGRFREIFCTVLDARGDSLPDYRPCEEALTRVGVEPPGTGKPVNLGMANLKLVYAVVPGVGWECIENWMNYQNEFYEHVGQFAYDSHIFKVDGLSGTENNARQIRDAILQHADEIELRSLVLVGYSKGAPDILTAIVGYPELAARVDAVVSLAGAVGGSPLSVDATQAQANMLTMVPGSQCEEEDGEKESPHQT